MVETFTVQHIDGEVTYTAAPADVQAALRRRFENPTGLAAIDPRNKGYYLFDVRNWWDGPNEIKDNGDGTLTFEHWWEKGKSDTFSV